MGRQYIDPGPESQVGAREALKGPIALVIDVLFWFVFIWEGGGVYFQLFLVYLEK